MAAEYQMCPLGHVASVRSGYAFSSKDWLTDGVPVIKISNIKDGRIVMDDCSFVSTAVASMAMEHQSRPGDILIAMTGYIGEVGLVRDSAPMMVNQRVGRFTVRDASRLEPAYLYYCLRSAEIRREIEGAGYGSAQPNVSPTLIEATLIPLPPLPEQRAIARILGALDDKIELNRRMNATLEAIARALFQSWFVDFDPVRAKAEGRHPAGMDAATAALFPDAFEESQLGMVPQGWRVLRLGEVISFEYGKALKEDLRRPGTFPVFGANGQVGWHDEALVIGPGVVVGRKGNPGTVTWAPADFFPIDTTFFVVPAGHLRYLHFWFHALDALDLSHLGSDSAVPGLNRNMAYMTQVLVPSALVIEAFEQYVMPFVAGVHANDSESRTLAAIRDALLPKLLSGEVRVREAEALVEAAI